MANEIKELRYQVGEAWKGAYNRNTSYGLAAVVQDAEGLSVYRSLKSGNAGHALTDGEWWMKIIDLSTIKAASDGVDALNKDMAAAEAERNASEESRQSAETARAKAETQRIGAEQTRESRETERGQNEQTRVSAEQQRMHNEDSRVTSESRREAQEATRQQQETARKNAETQRQTAEMNRAGAETQRIAAENSRTDNERQREANESERKKNETQRETDFAAGQEARTAAYEAAEEGRAHAYTTAETGRNQAYSEAEQGRDAVFAEKEEARDKTVDDKVGDITQLQEQVTALQAVVADIESLAEGYVRLAGSSNPALSYKTYKYHEQGDFGRESTFGLFYPCLVGTKLTGDDEQVGTILHVLQKLGARPATAEDTDFAEGQAVWDDIYGTPHALDGSEGDVFICNVEPYYQIAGKRVVEGTEYDVFLVSREPFTWQGHEAEEVERWGQSPDYTVSHQDADGVQRMHSVYNPEWAGSYTAPVGVAGKYVYSQDEETGIITDTYDAEATLLGGAGGCHTTDKNLPTAEQEAMNMNDDTAKTVPFYNHHAEICNRTFALMLAEGGTFDAHRASLMGSGFCANDPANAQTFEASGSEARNGLRYENSQDAVAYMSLGQSNAFGLSGTYGATMINSWRNPFKVMEAHRAVSYAVRRGVGELEWFVYEGNKYKYRSVEGFRGPQEGELTCVVWKMLSGQLTSAATDPATGAALTGKRVDFIISVALFHGVTTQVSPSWWESGLIFSEDEEGNYLAYLARDQTLLLKSPTADIDASQQYNFEQHYQQVGPVFTKGEGHARNYLSGEALMLPDTNANKAGGGLHTYVGKYNWLNGAAAPAGKRSVRGFRRGGYALYSNLSPLTLGAYDAPSYAYTVIGFGTCVRLR